MTSSECLVSVVVPCYNRLNLLKNTAASLLSQSETRCEYVFVDDRSDEETSSFLYAIARDCRVRLIRKAESEPRGCQASRNLGLAAARGRYLMFLDSDDLLEQHCLRDRLEFAAGHSDADVIVGSQAMFFEQRANAVWVNQIKPDVPELDRFLHLTAPTDVPWVNGGCLFRTERLRCTGVRWRSEFLWDDALFHIECLLAGLSVAWMPAAAAPDSWYRLHGTEQFSQELQSTGACENVATMLVYLAGQLAAAGQLSLSRRKQLLRAAFVKAVLPLLDSHQFSAADEILKRLLRSRYFPPGALQTMLLYAAVRRTTIRSVRFTYWANQLFRRLLPEAFYGGNTGSYGRLPADESLVFSLLSRLQGHDLLSVAGVGAALPRDQYLAGIDP